MSTYMTVYKCICMHVCMYVCMYICMHVRIHVCIYVILKLGFEQYGWNCPSWEGELSGVIFRGELSGGNVRSDQAGSFDRVLTQWQRGDVRSGPIDQKMIMSEHPSERDN